MDLAPAMRRFVLVAALLLPPLILPRWVCGWSADRWFEGDESTQRRLGDHVAQVVAAHQASTFCRTGAERFDGQSAVAIYQMTLLGLGQLRYGRACILGATVDKIRSPLRGLRV